MFNPSRVIFEEQALEYPMGKELLKLFQGRDIEIKYSKSARITGIPGETAPQKYGEGKNTLVVGVRKTLKFQSCMPSAHYQLPLVSGCMGMCEYCYLNTQMGKKPYVKIHVNVDEILSTAAKYAKERQPKTTIFEGAATSDPIPVEPYSHALESAIKYFGQSDHIYFRFVTKYTDVDNLLKLKHNGRTTIRFSINTDTVIKSYEHRTPSFIERVEAAEKVLNSGYNLGFIIAPVFLYENWEEEYKEVIDVISNRFRGEDVKFEVISHRFTKRAKENILDIFPSSRLPMKEEERTFKFGQFGYGKYVYSKEQLNEMKSFFMNNLTKAFHEENINYII